MSQGQPVRFNWQKFLEAVAANLPAIIALITALIEAIVSSGGKMPPNIKAALDKLQTSDPDS